MAAFYKYAVAIGLLLAFPGTAYAYIDPGTGAMLIQGLIGTVVGGLFVIRLYWRKIKSFVTGGGESVSEEEDVQANERQHGKDI